MQLDTDSGALANGLAEWSGIQKEHGWKIIGKEIWGRGMGIDISKGGKNLKIFVSPANDQQRVTSAEEDFNNYLESLSHLWLAVSLFPKPSWSSSNGITNKVATVARTEVMPGLSLMYFHSLPLAMISTKHQIYQEQRPTLSLWPTPGSASHLVVGYLHCTPSIMVGAVFCFHWNSPFWIWIFLPECNASAKTIMCCLQNI